MTTKSTHGDGAVTALEEAVVAHGEAPLNGIGADEVLSRARNVAPSAESARLLLCGRRRAPSDHFMREAEFALASLGVAHAVEVGDPGLFEELLDGVTTEEVCLDGEAHRALVYPERWTRPYPEGWGCFSQLAAHIAVALVGAAPPGSESVTRRRRAITSISLNGEHIEYGWDRDFPVDLTRLGTLVNLRRLEVRDAHPVLGLEAIAALPALERLIIARSELPVVPSNPLVHTLSELLRDPAYLPGLRHLDLVNNLVAREYRDLIAPGVVHYLDLTALAGRPLVSLSLVKCAEGSEHTLGSLTTLESLTLGFCVGLEHIVPLVALVTLSLGGKAKKGPVPSSNAPSLSMLTRLPRLRRARIPCCPTDEDLAWLPDHPTLERLELSCEGKHGRKLRRRLTTVHETLKFV